jgi:hypothetical protein
MKGFVFMRFLAFVLILASVACLDTLTISRAKVVKHEKMKIIKCDTTLYNLKTDTIKILYLDTLWDIIKIVPKKGIK